MMYVCTTKILTLSSKSMHHWNPLCKGFILSHFGQACCVGQHCILIHVIIRKSLLKYCKRHPKGIPRRERVKGLRVRGAGLKLFMVSIDNLVCQLCIGCSLSLINKGTKLCVITDIFGTSYSF